MSIEYFPPIAGSTASSTSAPWYLQVARGKVAGVSPVRVFGYQASVGTTLIPIWENATAYTYPVTAQTMTLYSSSAADTNVAVIIQGLDANFIEISETLILTNGTTGVTTVNQYLRINGLFTQDITHSLPVGVIHLSNAAKTVTYGQINLLDGLTVGKSQASIYTVPAGSTFYLTRVNAYSDENTGANASTYSVYLKNNVTGQINQVLTTPFTIQYDAYLVTPFAYTEKTDLQWQAKGKSSTHAIGMVVEGVLIDNTAA